MGMEDEEIAVDESVPKETKLSVENVIDQLGGFGWYQQRLFAMSGFAYFVIGAVILQQVAVERAPSTVCQTAAPNCTTVCSSDDLFTGSMLDYSTAAATFQLVCGRSILRGYIGSIFFVGFGIGSFGGGHMADKVGRKRALFAVHAILCCGALTFLAPSFEVYFLLRLVAGIGCGGGIVVGFVLIMEFLPNRHRGWMGGFGMNGLWSSGGVAMGLVAALVHHLYASLGAHQHSWDEWRLVSLSAWLLSLVACLTTAFAPESPRWFLAQGEPDKAREALAKVARANRAAMPEGELCADGGEGPKEEEVEEEEEEGRGGGKGGGRRREGEGGGERGEEGGPDGADDKEEMLGGGGREGDRQGLGLLFSHREVLGVPLVYLTSVNLLCWFTASFSFYGLALNTGNMAGDFYTNVVVMNLVDVLALLLSILMFNRLGRARTNSLTLVIGGLACVGVNLVPVAPGCEAAAEGGCANLRVRNGLALAGKFMMAITFSGVFIYASEAFPSTLRSRAMGISSLSARVGGVSAPFVVLLSEVSPALPMWIFGLVALGTGIVSVRLPETLGRKLADRV